MVVAPELVRPSAPAAGAPADPPSPGSVAARFLDDVRAGLSRDPKTLPSRWLYDDAGAALFEAITTLPEYYPTRTETAILAAHAAEMLDGIGPGAAVVEYGAGASIKTRLLLDACEAPARYVPLDVSDAFDAEVDADLRGRYPGLEVRPVVGDFLDPQRLGLDDVDGPRLGLFLGSTIGNLEDAEIERFLGQTRDALGAGATLLLGVDVVKDAETLEAAYDDAAGVTARFDLNLLTRMNAELGADFDVDAFAHEARWVAERSRIEMHLVAARAQDVRVAGRRFRFGSGESVRTEISRKFADGDVARLAARRGWGGARTWTDPAGLFSVVRLEAVP